MQLSTVFAKLTSGNAKVLSALGAMAIAGVTMTAATPAAEAQVAFGVAFGGPRYYAPAPPPRPVYRTYGYGGGYAGYGYAPGYWQHRRYEDWRTHEVWAHRHDWGYGRSPYYGR